MGKHSPTVFQLSDKETQEWDKRFDEDFHPTNYKLSDVKSLQIAYIRANEG